jgi:indole-3-glycerol phosphate synthase
MKKNAHSARANTVDHRFRKALGRPDRVNVIAEIKRASPSKGVINGDVDVAETARSYQSAGAAAISVLTEESYFRGSLGDLRVARHAATIPLLRKDFIVEDYQIYEAAHAGADAVLLIVSALTSEQIKTFIKVAEDELGIDALVEVHSLNELETALECGAKIMGVNNRNLRTFEVSLDVSRELVRSKPDGVLMITESGISTAEEIAELHALGFDGFLVGEALMRSADPGGILKAWT